MVLSLIWVIRTKGYKALNFVVLFMIFMKVRLGITEVYYGFDAYGF